MARAHEEDELFHVIKGKLTVEFRDKVVELLPGEILVVPQRSGTQATC